METLNSKKVSVLSTETRVSLKERYTGIIQEYRNIVRILNILNEMERIIAPYNVKIGVRILNKLSTLYKDYESVISCKNTSCPSQRVILGALRPAFTENISTNHPSLPPY
ncbi:hypothetical protein LOD99_4289 [Oopsacas minuta]|uniref:Uncharacterized protein n=1 Tax=Oopsacas minuta TaxID=111878 RepID=A0AAV7JV53_9METZ|nr:hypothetical protein LOD99_4289 [Oopsacas minuta]